jgi:hypothetical protein
MRAGNERIKIFASIVLLFFITLGVFLYTVEIRKPWFGIIAADDEDFRYGHHQWLSGSTLKFVRIWYREGPWEARFGKIQNPRSVEFPTLLSRNPYPSYACGTIIPVYMISRLTGDEPTPSLLMSYNLLNHFAIAFFLSLTIFLLLLQLSCSGTNAFLLSGIPIVIQLLLPAPLYWHQNVFGSDQAVILPFVLFVFLEVARGSSRRGKGFAIIWFLQALLLFYGVITDWFFIFIAFVVYVKRVLNGELGSALRPFIKKSLLFWFPLILAMFLFILQLHYLGVLHLITEKFLFRAGLSQRGRMHLNGFYKQFWKGHIALGYGEIAI